MRGQHGGQLLDRKRIEPDGRFVKKPKGSARQREPAERKAALLSGGQHPRRQVRKCAKVKVTQSGVHVSGGEAGSKLKILGNGKARLDGIQVTHVGDAGGMGGAVG